MEDKKRAAKEKQEGILIPIHEIRIDSEETFLTIELLEKAAALMKNKKTKNEK